MICKCQLFILQCCQKPWPAQQPAVLPQLLEQLLRVHHC
jgi:hypothetical protein